MVVTEDPVLMTCQFMAPGKAVGTIVLVKTGDGFSVETDLKNKANPERSIFAVADYRAACYKFDRLVRSAIESTMAMS